MKEANRFKLARTQHNQHGTQSVKEVANVTGITKSLIDDLESTAGKPRNVSYLKVKTLAEHYGVSSDYLLGISSVPSVNMNIQTVCKVTKLSEKAVDGLINCGNPMFSGAWKLKDGKAEYPYCGIDAINLLLESDEFEDFAASLALVMLHSNDSLFHDSQVDVSQEEIDRVLDFLESRGQSTLEREKAAKLELQVACDTLKNIFDNVLKKRRG